MVLHSAYLFGVFLTLPLSFIVLMFQEVWGRSFCRTIEKLVEVVQEYPTEVEHIYSPACVPLIRCAGCCGDENLECHPTQTTNVTMQVGWTRPGQQYVEMTFVEHQTCESPHVELHLINIIRTLFLIRKKNTKYL
uniref:Platelet-derived growth factor (PDGF) family profile domain-containing protein n=1 Tax=Mola mola TaxID=94237 RepID=A0A3Q3VRN0_MOLML